jgi:hypothetical protein
MPDPGPTCDLLVKEHPSSSKIRAPAFFDSAARPAATATGVDENDHGAKLHLTPDVRLFGY